MIGIEVLVLIILGFIWVLFASIQDIRSTEVANWLNFSLIIFALGFRFFYSLFATNNFIFFYQGIIGLIIFIILGNLFYYLKVFAGGDAKLMIALGTILPLTNSFSTNIKIMAVFLILFLFVGGFYGLFYGIFLAISHFKNFKKDFVKKIKNNKKLIILTTALAIIIAILSILSESVLIFLAIIIFIIPYLFLFAKSIDEACMIKNISPSKLQEGDWLYKDLKIKGKTIKAKWDGLSKKEIVMLKRANKKVWIRKGIPFVPVFLISYLILVGCFFILGYSLWNSYFVF